MPTHAHKHVMRRFAIVAALLVLMSAGIATFIITDGAPPATVVPYTPPNTAQAPNTTAPNTRPGAATTGKPGLAGAVETRDGAGDAAKRAATLRDARPSPQEVARAAGAARRGETTAGSAHDHKPRVAKETVREGVSKVVPLVKRCYEKLLDDFPQAGGKVTTSFTVKAHEGIGEVMNVRVVEDKSTLFDDRMNACMGRAIQQITFPIDGDDEGVIKVTYPFKFASGEDDRAKQ